MTKCPNCLSGIKLGNLLLILFWFSYECPGCGIKLALSTRGKFIYLTFASVVITTFCLVRDSQELLFSCALLAFVFIGIQLFCYHDLIIPQNSRRYR